MSDLQIALAVLIPFGLTGLAGLWYLATTLATMQSEIGHLKEKVRWIFSRLGGQDEEAKDSEKPKFRVVR